MLRGGNAKYEVWNVSGGALQKGELEAPVVAADVVVWELAG